MNYRAIVIGIDNDFAYIQVKNTGNFHDFQRRSYRKDKEANLQVIDENGNLKGIVESIYFEGIAAPVGSNLVETDITKQVFQEVHSTVFAEPNISFWDKLFRRN